MWRLPPLREAFDKAIADHRTILRFPRPCFEIQAGSHRFLAHNPSAAERGTEACGTLGDFKIPPYARPSNNYCRGNHRDIGSAKREIPDSDKACGC